MVLFNSFEVEKWMDTYEYTPDVLNVAETCCSSISMDELSSFSDGNPVTALMPTSRRLTYGSIRGSSALRHSVANLCSDASRHSLTEDNVIITQGAIGANFLVLYSLIGPGDHVICVYPTYQQLYSVPVSLGADVSLWTLRSETGYIPSVNELSGLIRDSTKMIIINNPNNPTGAVIPTGILEKIAALAKERGIILLSDEVYRPLFHNGYNHPNSPPPATALDYEKIIVTGSMSKAFALAGIRIGWIASRDRAILERLAAARDYTTISVSQLDDYVAGYALSSGVIDRLLRRNVALAATNLSLLKEFVDAHNDICHWVQPSAGTTAFIQFCVSGRPVDDVSFCKDLLEKTQILFCPGSLCFGGGRDFLGFVRVGYVCETTVLQKALTKLDNKKGILSIPRPSAPGHLVTSGSSENTIVEYAPYVLEIATGPFCMDQLVAINY
ncbi:Pyridoxal phosphate-dependent transferase, major domain protein [Metarhizium album ARSEF 1941]|uniref:Pyridoxal phosphate-dependent transferase, major domain protein n=1 Tax=Metarhizium album (strain ARSEF 1941) TaxID=1081103 RepID=A0A0B2WUE8_METAS|nr:Pyridoxal phosphate-dependent transferase, major domain protein [Metarhizium album ARSEF 1941]KHN97693.1 Pyridoxal phosphate-dependent transferase, major domain protein [Metarhizium album ARSEF 1941]